MLSGSPVIFFTGNYLHLFCGPFQTHTAELLTLMEQSQADYTIVFRLLATFVEMRADAKESDSYITTDDGYVTSFFANAFYATPDEALKTRWLKWLNDWILIVRNQKVCPITL